MAHKKEKIFPSKGFVDRFNAIKKHSKLTQLEMLKKIGYTSPSILHNALYPTHGLSNKFITGFVKHFPLYSVEWLIQGTGEMLKKTKEVNKEIQVGIKTIESVFNPSPLLTEKIRKSDPDVTVIKKEVLLDDGDSSSVLWDHSMEPSITPGNLVILRKVKDRLIVAFGQVYQVTTEDYRIVRRLLPGKDESHVILEAVNPGFAPINIPLEKITDLHLVIGNIARMAN